MSKLFKHLKTIRLHRRAVRQACFKMGITLQGLLHDLSKYSITELKIAKYYSGKGSPHQVCREINGYSPSWIHHYHCQKHHTEFWLDSDEFGKFIPIKMPFKYVIEMFCDTVGAGKAYMKDKWTCEAPWEYHSQFAKANRLVHKDTLYLLEKLLWNLKMTDEKHFYKWYKETKDWLKQHYEKGELDY